VDDPPRVAVVTEEDDVRTLDVEIQGDARDQDREQPEYWNEMASGNGGTPGLQLRR
jgi:hypothetical protein